MLAWFLSVFYIFVTENGLHLRNVFYCQPSFSMTWYNTKPYVDESGIANSIMLNPKRKQDMGVNSFSPMKSVWKGINLNDTLPLLSSVYASFIFSYENSLNKQTGPKTKLVLHTINKIELIQIKLVVNPKFNRVSSTIVCQIQSMSRLHIG